MTSVDVLPGYASETTRTTAAALSEPWSGQTLAIPQHPAIPSLDGMLLSE